MFWKKKAKLPITEEDRLWVNENLEWLQTELGDKMFTSIKTVTPTKDFYNRDFTGTEEDAEYILQRTMELMCIEVENISLDYFSDEPVELSDGTTLTTPADSNGQWNSAAGTYEKTEDGTIISIERGQLKNPISLIATIAHELCHEVLLGDNRIEENDEYLTDLTAIVYGFGVFIGNSKFNFSSFSSGSSFGWESSGQGYLPEQVIGYAMAKLSYLKQEDTSYSQFLDKTLQSFFNQSVTYLNANM
jgi:hypothetical protein